MWKVLLFILFINLIKSESNIKRFVKEMEDMKKETEEKYKHLMDQDENGYYLKVTEEQAKFVFNYIDVDQDEKLNRDELIHFGKLTVSNNTESAGIWADTVLLDDQNGDKKLTFIEFHKPIIEYGARTDDKVVDERHQHKSGHLHDEDPVDKVEL